MIIRRNASSVDFPFVSSVHTLTEVYIKHSPSMSSDDILRRSSLSLHGHPNHHSSEHDALSWEQHKMLAGRRRDRQSIHGEGRKNSEIMEQRTSDSPGETTSVPLDFGEETIHCGPQDQRMPEAWTNNQPNKFQSLHRQFGWTANVDSELNMKATAAHYYDNGAHFPENEFRHENIHKNSWGISYTYDTPGDDQRRSSSQTALLGSDQSHSISQQYYQSHPVLSDRYAFPKELSNPSTLHVDVASYDEQFFPLRQVTNNVTPSSKQPTTDLRNLGAGTEVLDKALNMDIFSRRSTSQTRSPRRRNLEQDFEISASGWHGEQNQDYHSSAASSQNVDESNRVVEDRLSSQKHLQEYADLVEWSGHHSGRRTEKASKPQTVLNTSATDFQVLDRQTRHRDEVETQKLYYWHKGSLNRHDKVLSKYLHSPVLESGPVSDDSSELLSSHARMSMPSHLHSTGLSSGSRIPVSQAALNPSTDDVHDLLLSSVTSGSKMTNHSMTKSHPVPTDAKHSTMPPGGGSLHTQLDTIPLTTSRNRGLTQRLETTQRLSRTLTVSGQHDSEFSHLRPSSMSASGDQQEELTSGSSKRSVATDAHSPADPSVIRTRLSAEESIQLRHSSGKQYESPVSQEVGPNDQHRSSKLDNSSSYHKSSHNGKSLELPARRGHQSDLTSPTKRSQLQINSYQWRVPEEMPHEQSSSHYDDNDLLLSDLSAPAMGNPRPLSQPKDTVPGSSVRKHGGTHKLSASAGTRRTTSVLWVSKLVDLLCNKPVKKHEVLVAKAYWFKKWQRCVRLFKLKRQEEQDQLRKATTFHQISLQQKILREWHCEVQSKYHAARLLHQRHLLLKGFNAFRFAVISIRVQREQLERRLRHDKLAKCFNKWKALVCWRSERESLLEQLAMQHVTVKAFRVWREGYHTQQRNGIADLHYKVCLLSKCLEYWRRYVVGRRKKFCRTEMARVFHEDRVVKRAWVTMVTVAMERQRARRLYRRFTLTRAWTAWKHGTQIVKMENLHGNSQAVVFRQQAVLRRHFAEWRERARLSLMRGQIEKRQVRQAFQLWKLKVHRRQLVYRILESRSRKTIKKSALIHWRRHTREVKERRQEAVRLVVRVQLRVVMTTWRNWACRQIQLRTNLHQCLAARAVETERAAFLRWRSLVRERHAGREARERWSHGCVSRAAVRWRLVVKKARQEVEVEMFLRRAEESLVKSAFLLWHGALLRAEEDRRRVEEARLRLAESHLHRSLLAWKLEMLEARAVRPLTERRKKRNLARVFDAWRDVAERTKAGLEFTTHRQVRCLSRSFSFWRAQTVSMQSWRREQEEVDADLVRSCFQAWSRLHQRAVAGKAVARQRDAGCLRDAFLSWKAMVEEAEMERDNKAGDEGRKQVLQRVFFRAWQRARGEKEAEEDEKCRTVQDRQLTVTLTKAWTQWRKSLQLEITARAVEARMRHRLLHQAFWAWHSYVQSTMEGAVHEFSCKLDRPASTSPQGWKISGAGTTLSYATSSFSSSSSHRLDNQSPPGATPSPLREVSSYHTPYSPRSQESLSLEESDVDSVSPKSSQEYVTAATSLSQIRSPQVSSEANTPSPLQSLSLHLPETADPAFLEEVEVRSQNESVDGSMVSLEEGHSSSARSAESQPSYLGRSSIADSGYSGNGLFHHLGDRQLEVSSESASVRSMKSSSSVAVETHSPHSNNCNNVMQSNASFWQNRFKEDDLQGHFSFDEGRYSNLRDFGPHDFRNGYHVATSPSRCGTHVLTDDLVSLTKRTYTEKKEVRVERSIYYSHNEGYDHRMMEMERPNGYGDGDGNDGDTCIPLTNSSCTSPESLGRGSHIYTTSVITNRRTYLTSVILRLRLWPASAAFYQWLDVVRKRKAQRHCCQLVQRGTATRLLRDSFMHWQQAAWKNQMASAHCDKVLLRKCIHRWSTVKHLQAEREVQESGASEHAAVSRLMYAWNTWKDRYLRSQYATGQVPSWDAHISQSRVSSQKCAMHQTKIQGRNLRECLVFWKLRWWQLKQADLFHEKVLVQRCLKAWLAWHREKRWREEAARSLLEKRRKKLAFHHWRSQLLRREQVHWHYHSAAHSHLCLIVRVWHRWAATSRKLRLSREMVDDQRSVALVRRGWAMWRAELEKVTTAKLLHDRKVLKRCFASWKETAHKLKCQRAALDSIQSVNRSREVAQYFRCWKMAYKAKHFAAARQARESQAALRGAWYAWKDFVTERQRDRLRQRELVEKVLETWLTHYEQAKHRRRLAVIAATKWRHVVRRSQELEEVHAVFSASVETSRLRDAFHQWQRALISRQLAVCYHDNKVLRSSFLNWKCILTISQQHTSMEQMFAHSKQENLLSKYFRKWQAKQSHVTTLRASARKVKVEMDVKTMSAFFSHWRQRQRERQAEHGHRRKLVAMAWLQWKKATANKRKVARLRESRDLQLAGKVFSALRDWSRDRSNRRIILQCMQARKNHFTLKATFALWWEKSRKATVARQHHTHGLRRRVISSWKTFTVRKRILTSLQQEMMKKMHQRLVRSAFRQWEEEYRKARELQNRLDAYRQEKEDQIMAKCFGSWRNAVLEEKARRMRERLLSWRVIKKWRRRVETRRLIAQYEQDLDDLANLHWSHQVMRRQFRQWRAALVWSRWEKRKTFLEMKYWGLWKGRVYQRMVSEAVARYWSLRRSWKAWRKHFIQEQVSRRMLEEEDRILVVKVFKKWRQLSYGEKV
ncbi:uncharacterized protein [Diadema setosum]|uniref:uncharacterized protein n=1 Tax=Diadema setosum TaxID=31175 RepID=UPI003B3A2968